MASPEGRKVRVLFIDDDGSIRIFASVMFNNQMFDITVVEDTNKADLALKAGAFDIIVCDVMMPGEDGVRYCNRLKKSGISTPFVFLSAVSHPDMVKMGLLVGANAYFVKPFDPKELQKQIMAIIRPSSKPSASSKEVKKPKNWFGRF